MSLVAHAKEETINVNSGPWTIVTLLTCLLVLSGAETLRADQIYTGSLQYTPPAPEDAADELAVGGPAGQWDAKTITIFWTVTDNDATYAGYPWKYEYRILLSSNDHAYSHLSIEVSDGFSDNDIVGLTNATIDAIDTQKTGQANQGMPEDYYAIKFNPPEDNLIDWTFWFFSNRVAVWGDGYVRDGGKGGIMNHAYNYNMDENGVETGFLSPDIDPTDPASAGTAENHYFYHILRPDTAVLPEPATLALVGTGFLLLIGIVRRRRMR